MCGTFQIQVLGSRRAAQTLKRYSIPALDLSLISRQPLIQLPQPVSPNLVQDQQTDMVPGDTANVFTASDRIKQLNDIDRVRFWHSVRWKKS